MKVVFFIYPCSMGLYWELLSHESYANLVGAFFDRVNCSPSTSSDARSQPSAAAPTVSASALASGSFQLASVGG